MCRLLPYCAAAARETGPRRPVSTPSIRCSELRLERLTPGKKLRRKGSPRSEGTSRHSYLNCCCPYRTGGLRMSSTRCFRVSSPENGRCCRGHLRGAFGQNRLEAAIALEPLLDAAAQLKPVLLPQRVGHLHLADDERLWRCRWRHSDKFRLDAGKRTR